MRYHMEDFVIFMIGFGAGLVTGIWMIMKDRLDKQG